MDTINIPIEAGADLNKDDSLLIIGAIRIERKHIFCELLKHGACLDSVKGTETVKKAREEGLTYPGSSGGA